jgi:hypothetical protein
MEPFLMSSSNSSGGAGDIGGNVACILVGGSPGASCGEDVELSRFKNCLVGGSIAATSPS